MKRVNKIKARNLYNSGQTIYLVPCKVPGTMKENNWIKPQSIRKIGLNSGFDSVVNNFSYYNCQYNELGRYPAYYIE